MRKSRKSVVESNDQGGLNPAGVEGESKIVAVHRAWLITLAALVIVPWLVACAIYFGFFTAPATVRSADTTKNSAPFLAAPGPWGSLAITPITISPPLEYVAADWGRINGPDEWYFPGTPVETMEAFLSSAGLSPEQVRSIRATARPDPRTRGLVVRPDANIVRSLSPQVRARIYLELGKVQLNFDQANAFRFYGASLEDWFRGSSISPQTRRLVEPLIYRNGDYFLFADPEVVRVQIPDAEELRRLGKTLLREATMVVKLKIEDDTQAAKLADYWGRGGRRTDLRPLLESVADSVPDRSIDIVHLLPTFARNQLYRYPRITAEDLNRPMLANCLWSALNFFNSHPDERFRDVNVALKSLKNDYFLVETGFQLGDIVAFLDANGNLFHVAVYLADDLVFSKNGMSPVAPWIITTIDRLKGYYSSRSSNPQILVHRRNDL
ncbi:MAG TPA: hypothetical protein VNL38_02695 [Candidatus Nitrosotenuis sp.]|nr:hypothetical protein [Candidatus Nitrosotenuis sp.]